MADKTRITKHPNIPPPLWIDGYLVQTNPERIVIHMFTSHPPLPAEPASEDRVLDTVNLEVQVTTMMSPATLRHLAERLAQIVQEMEAIDD